MKEDFQLIALSKSLLPAVSHLKDTAQHTKDAAGAKYNKNVAEAKQHLKSGEHPELEAQKEAAKSQEKASTAAAKGHATDVSTLHFSLDNLLLHSPLERFPV